MHRNTREVLAFIVWARTHLTEPPPDVPFAVCGSFAHDTSFYLYLSQRKVPVWLTVQHTGLLDHNPVPVRSLQCMCILTTWREVQTKDVTCVDWEEVTHGIFKLKHTKSLWFYPLVSHQAHLECAARACKIHNDKMNSNKMYNKCLRALQSMSFIAVSTASH